MTAKTFEEIIKFNPYHDARGRFSSANSFTSFTYSPGKSKAHDLAIQRQMAAAGGANRSRRKQKQETKPKELKTEKEFDQHAAKYKGWEDSLSDGERKVVGRYQTESFAFNHKLRNGDPDDYDEFVFGKQATTGEYKKLDSALAKSKIQDDVTVFRAISDVDALGDISNLKGSTITDRGYASTSLNKNAATDYGDGIILKINVKKGSSGAYISGVKDSNGRDFKDNREILLPRNSKFKVLNAKKTGGRWEVEMDYEG